MFGAAPAPPMQFAPMLPPPEDTTFQDAAALAGQIRQARGGDDEEEGGAQPQPADEGKATPLSLQPMQTIDAPLQRRKPSMMPMFDYAQGSNYA